MDEFQSTVRHVQAFILALTLSLTEFLKKYIEKMLPPQWEHAAVMTWLLIFICLFILIELLQYAINNYVERSQWLRRKLLGDNFIEGIWKDVVTWNTNEGKFLTGGLVEITFSKGKLHVSGESFDASGRRIGSFRSLVASYRDRVLTYSFSKFDSTTERGASPGYAEYHFQVQREHAIAFDGFFFREGEREKMQVSGERLGDEELGDLEEATSRARIVSDYVYQRSHDLQ
jgi:hypothetical protein